MRSIVLVTGSLEGGGAERVLAGMANYWASKGVSVTLATWAGPEVGDFYRLDAAVHRVWLNAHMPEASLTSKARAAAGRVRLLRSLLARLKPDAVLSFIHTSNVTTILACLGLEARVVVSERMQPAVDSSLSFGWKLLRRLCYRWSDVIVAQSRDAARWISRQCGKQAVVIPNPLRSLPRIEGARQPLVLAVGRLNRQKGFDLLLRAFAEVATQFPEWRLAIIGIGGELASLMRLRDELRLADRVEFVGQVSDVESWMVRAGLVVQPSRCEGFPNAVLESMGMGAAVISADCPSGPSELINDGVNGRLVPVEDVARLAQVMRELMSQPETRESLGREAQKVRLSFSEERIMAQWEACLAPEVEREA